MVLQRYCTFPLLATQKGNTHITRKNSFSLAQVKQVHYLTRRALNSNSLVQKTCMFPQKEISPGETAVCCPGPKHYVIYEHFYSKNLRRLRFPVFLYFHARKHTAS